MHVRNFTLKTFTLSFCMFLFYFFLICARDVKKANGFWAELGNNQVDTNGPGTWVWFWILGSTAILHIKSSPQNVPKLTKMIPKVSKIMHLGHTFFSGPRQTSFLHCLPTWVKFPIWTGTWVLQYSIPSTRIRMGILTKQKVESSSITRLIIIDSKKQPSSHLEYMQLFPPHLSRKNCKKDAVADALNKFVIHLNTPHFNIFQEKLAFF